VFWRCLLLDDEQRRNGHDVEIDLTKSDHVTVDRSVRGILCAGSTPSNYYLHAEDVQISNQTQRGPLLIIASSVVNIVLLPSQPLDLGGGVKPHLTQAPGLLASKRRGRLAGELTR
jgi:hypothetical protein